MNGLAFGPLRLTPAPRASVHTSAPFLPRPLHPSPAPAEMEGVKHITLQTDDVPLAPILMDRRRHPDRRAIWRGGRRDSDWFQRPPGAWTRMAVQPTARWQRVLASLHLW